MKKAFVAMAAMLLLATASMAAFQVEVDLDGVQGNGVDYITVNQSDYIAANVWILGQGNCWWVFGMYLCNYDHSLEYQSVAFAPSPGGGWAFPPVQPPTPEGCITVQGQNLSFDIPMCAPWHICTITYHAAVDGTLDEIFLGAESAVLTSVSFVTSSFTNNETVVGQVQIGIIQTGVEETNWGAVKSLFR